MFSINTFIGHTRMSTQDLLQAIYTALAAGETEYHITASGQHDIGGPLWHPDGKPLRFVISNPGQRVGAMCLEGTEIIVEGAAPADVGWLNAGGRIVVRGDAGDTAAHCAAAGTIYIGGRAGARSGSLMKHDPLYPPPEFWVLKSCGSFSFEFMSGGIAVVCGYDCPADASVLGDRSCVGMVGGLVYYRGRARGLSTRDVKVVDLDDDDRAYLDSRMDDFLAAIGRPELRPELSRWQEWHKVVPLTYEERPKRAAVDIRGFRRNHWIKGGLFADVCQDDNVVLSLVPTGLYRQRVPLWQSQAGCRDCRQCLQCCPQHAIVRQDGGEAGVAYAVTDDQCIGCGICAGICPSGVWRLAANPVPLRMYLANP